MAARLLRHVNLALTMSAWNSLLGANVPAARALVGVLVVAHTGTSGTLTIDVNIGNAGGSSTLKLVGNLSLQPGESWEQRVVVPTGNNINIFVSGTSNGQAATIMGEEVDN